MYFNSNDTNTFDAIVIGSGVSGGWAAKELCEKGLKTLVLERGRPVRHMADYPTMNTDPWDLPMRGALTAEEREKFHVQNRSGFIDEFNKQFFINDLQNPYREDKRFDWIRGDQTGGKSLTWGRQCYRWSDLDFEANAKEGVGVDWPIRYKDIAPWYDYVEKFVGVSGEKLGLAHLPDGQFQKPMELNCVEAVAKEKIESTFPGRVFTIGRVANLTEQLNGRGPCQFRNRCNRGCPYSAYFSSVSVTLPAAEKTGNLTVRNHSIAHSIIYDPESGKASGVRIVDTETKEMQEFYAKVVFVCASAMASTVVLLNSTSDRFPNGLGNDSGELGHNLMDHHYFVGAIGSFPGMEDKYYKGRRPNGIYIPRFYNVDKGSKNDAFLRGFGYQGGASRSGWDGGINGGGIGADFKNKLFEPGGWSLALNGFGECLPDHDNRLYLHESEKDPYGIPMVVFDAEFKSNEIAMRDFMKNDASAMLEAAGCKDIYTFDYLGAPGKCIHEMGTARMGHDPKTSVLNKNNQVHSVPNVYVTDGACMTSSSCVNPSITYMALTARAVDHAVKELNRQNL